MGLIVDLFATLLALGIAVAAGPVIFNWYKRKQLKDPKQRVFQRTANEKVQGEVNHLVAKYDITRLCTECKHMTNPKIDLCLDGEWIHSNCYMTLVTGKKDNS